MNFGVHISIAGGIDKAPERAHEIAYFREKALFWAHTQFNPI